MCGTFVVRLDPHLKKALNDFVAIYLEAEAAQRRADHQGDELRILTSAMLVLPISGDRLAPTVWGLAAAHCPAAESAHLLARQLDSELRRRGGDVVAVADLALELDMDSAVCRRLVTVVAQMGHASFTLDAEGFAERLTVSQDVDLLSSPDDDPLERDRVLCEAVVDFCAEPFCADPAEDAQVVAEVLSARVPKVFTATAEPDVPLRVWSHEYSVARVLELSRVARASAGFVAATAQCIHRHHDRIRNHRDAVVAAVRRFPWRASESEGGVLFDGVQLGPAELVPLIELAVELGKPPPRGGGGTWGKSLFKDLFTRHGLYEQGSPRLICAGLVDEFPERARLSEDPEEPLRFDGESKDMGCIREAVSHARRDLVPRRARVGKNDAR